MNQNKNQTNPSSGFRPDFKTGGADLAGSFELDPKMIVAGGGEFVGKVKGGGAGGWRGAMMHFGMVHLWGGRGRGFCFSGNLGFEEGLGGHGKVSGGVEMGEDAAVRAHDGGVTDHA